MNVEKMWREIFRLERLKPELDAELESLDPQEARARRQAILRYLQRLKKITDHHARGKCPPAFVVYGCVLEDDTRCPYYHEEQCVKAQEEAI